MMRKRFFLWASLLWMLGAASVNAQTIYNMDNIRYRVADGQASVHDGSDASGDVKIRESVQDCPVTSIEDHAFSRCQGITSVTIPSSVVTIGSSSFYGCSNLQSVTMPKKLSYLGDKAFAYCGLEDVTVPEGITYIGENTFCDCKMKSMVIPEGVTVIGDMAFSMCKSLKSLTLPSTLKVIGSYAFQGCALTELVIPEGVDSISKGCSNDGIDECAFSFCENLTSVHIPASVRFIGQYTFYRCTKLTTMEVAEGNSVYDSRNGSNAIIETKTNTLIASCKTTTIPDGVAKIGDRAFAGISDLGTVTFPNSLTAIGDLSFRLCEKLTSVELPASLAEIGEGAFSDCPDLITVKSFLREPFELKAYTFSNRDIMLNEDTWEWVYDNTPYERITLYVPAGTKSAYQSTAGWSTFTNIEEFDADFSDGGLTYSAQPGSKVAVTGHEGISGEYEIPETVDHDDTSYAVTAIADRAFADNTDLTRIWIPASVGEIGTDAFSGCDNLVAVYCYAEQPADLATAQAKGTARAAEAAGGNAFAGIDKNACILYVPSGSLAAYQEADVWGEFVNIIEFDPATIKDPLTITACSVVREYGDENPALEFVLSDGGVLAGVPVLVCEADSASPVGVYPIVLQRGTVGNPNVTLQDGTLTVVVPAGIGAVANEQGALDVYDVRGVVVRKGAASLQGLPQGVYIINGRKVVK